MINLKITSTKQILTYNAINKGLTFLAVASFIFLTTVQSTFAQNCADYPDWVSQAGSPGDQVHYQGSIYQNNYGNGLNPPTGTNVDPSCSSSFRNWCFVSNCSSTSNPLSLPQNHNFNGGLESWVSGGAKAQLLPANQLQNQGWSTSGSNNINYNNNSCDNLTGNVIALRGSTNADRILTSPNYAMAGYDSVIFDYDYFVSSMDTSTEGWNLDYSNDNGSSWVTVKTYRNGSQFDNLDCGPNDYGNKEVVILENATYGFTNQSKFRMYTERDGGNMGAWDYLIIDNVTLTGNITSTCSAAGTILMERYDGISGTAISNLTGSANYPQSPSSTSQRTSFEIPSNVASNYGARVSGYICAPETGYYTFWIASDDNGQLNLSTDDDPTNKTTIATVGAWTNSRQWDKYASQKSNSVLLFAGNSYYVEALMKEAGGGDNLAVGWAKPGEATNSPSQVIPGSVLSPVEFCSTLTTYNVTTNDADLCTGDSSTIDLSGSQDGVSYQLKKDGVNESAPIIGTGSAISFTGVSAAGTYTVEASSCSNTLTMTGSVAITTTATPTQYSISADNDALCSTEQATITVANSESGVSYQLLLGGSAVSGSVVQGTGSAVNFTGVTAAGTYTVEATKNSCSATMTGNVVITDVADVAANFTTSATTFETNETITFTNTSSNAISYSWDFGDSSAVSTAANPTYSYSVAGTYTVTLTATNSCGSDTETTTITVTNAPVELFYENFSTESNNAVTGVDLYGTTWYSDDTSGNPDFFGVYNDSDFIDAVFWAEDTDGLVYWYTDNIDIQGYNNLNLRSFVEFYSIDNDGDYIKFYYKLDGGSLQEIATLTGDNTDTYYDWDLTGVTGDNLQIWVEFNSDDNNDYYGIGNVKLSGTLAPVVTPDADFSADNTTPDTGNIVTFTDLSTDIPTSWAWTFSNPGNVTYVNGTSASSQNPQVTFSTAGNYSVTLNATNASGTNGEIKTDYITVSTNENPASFTVIQSSTNPYTFLDLNATANTSNDNIIVAYNTTNTFGTPTTDASNTIILNGGGSIIFEGNANAIASNSLPQLDQNTTYYFKAWSIMSTGFSSGIEADETTAAVQAPLSLVASASDINNSITFSAAANSLNDNVMLVYNTSDDFGTPEDGVFYQIDDLMGNATVLLNSVNIESINNYIHDFLQLNTDYYYRIYSVATGIWYYSDSYRANDDQTIEGFIWQNDIQGSNPNQQNPYTTGDQVNSNIVVSGISRGTGLTGKNNNNAYKATGWSESASLNTANNDYFEFVLTPNSGYEINFNEFFYNAKDDKGDVTVVIRSSIDNYASNIGLPLDGDVDVDFDLSAPEFQNIAEAITFRIYGYDASDDDIEFKIESFGFKGTLSEYCTWNGTSWSKVPDLGIKATLNADYNTSIGGEQTSFRCKSLKVNSGKTLTIDNETFVEVKYNTEVNGHIVVETKGAFIQRDNDGVFSVNGTSQVNKSTPYKDQWYHYTYWSSPVVNMNIEAAFPNINRKFYFDGAAWQYATGQTMDAGKGYITTAPAAGIHTASFVGEFNTGTITTPIYYDAARDENWNLIGNPYPSSIDLNQFLGTNSAAIEGAAYFWSQETPPEGGQFSGTDYIPFNATGSVSSSSDTNRAVNGFAPSGQSFFIASKTAGNATFTNAMRMADATSNNQFFKNSNSVPKGSTANDNKLWINLSSNNGIFSQILVGYIDGATNLDDGLIYDATKFDEGSGTFLYSTIEDSNSKFVIQAKDVNSINADEIIPIGFKAELAAAYSLSIGKLQGDFLNNNTLFLKDKLNNITHDLSASDYTFTSEAGEFNFRFEIVFNANALSTDDITLNSKSLTIIELEDNRVQFTASDNLSIKTVTIFDLLGRQLYRFKGNNTSEIYTLPNLSSAVFIAKVELSNGVIVTKKGFKK